LSTVVNAMLSELQAVERRSVRAVTADYTATTDDYLVTVDASAGAVAITLPEAVSGHQFIAKKVDASGNAVTLSGQVDGSTSTTLTAQWGSVVLIGNGTQWLQL
jgi:hypothetical protein